jgi:serine/threonine protein kinase
MHLRRADIEMEARPIAAGSYKTVYRGSLRITVSGGNSRQVPVAVLKMRQGDVATEARMLLRICRPPRIVRFMGQCVEGNEELLLMEFAEHGSLSDAMETFEGKITFAHSMVILQQIAQAMEHLSSEGICHRDLAARNVLVFAFDEANVLRTSVKVSDYGMAAERFNRTHISLPSGDKPIRYMPPEALQKGRYSEKSDVWAFGVVCWEILTSGNIPYFEIDEIRIVTHVCNGGRLLRSQITGECPAALWALVVSCWGTLPKDRPTFSELVFSFGNITAQAANDARHSAEAMLGK